MNAMKRKEVYLLNDLIRKISLRKYKMNEIKKREKRFA